jgi:hypothetical protein
VAPFKRISGASALQYGTPDWIRTSILADVLLRHACIPFHHKSMVLVKGFEPLSAIWKTATLTSVLHEHVRATRTTSYSDRSALYARLTGPASPIRLLRLSDRAYGANDGIRTHDLLFRKQWHNPLCFVGMARLKGFEPPACCLEDNCTIRCATDALPDLSSSGSPAFSGRSGIYGGSHQIRTDE